LGAFNYAALDAFGKQTVGLVEAESKKQARQILRDQGLAPLEVSQVSSSAGDSGRSSQLGSSLSSADLALLTRQLATLIQAGLPVDEALGVVSEQSEKPRIRALLASLKSRVMEGHSLAWTMTEFPNLFPHLYRSMVAAGEHSGHLDTVMNRLADYTEASASARQRIRLALLYPVILLSMAVLIVSGLMAFVVPDVIEVFVNQGQTLPFLTRALIGLSHFTVSYGWLVVLLIVLLVIGFRLQLRQESFRLAWHKRIMQLPLLSRLSRTMNTARFSSTMSILVSSGIPLVEALDIGGQVLTNEYLKARVEEATQKVREGASLRSALEQCGYFPPMMVHMIGSGEASGELDTMLDRVAHAQQRELDDLVTTLIGIFEPAVLLFMGMAVLGIVVAILQPIFSLNQLI